MLENFIERLLSRRPPDIRNGPSAEALRRFHAKLNFLFSLSQTHGLRVRIRHNKFDAFKLAFDHVVHRISAGAADVDDGDARFQFSEFRNAKIEWHECLRLCACGGPPHLHLRCWKPRLVNSFVKESFRTLSKRLTRP